MQDVAQLVQAIERSSKARVSRQVADKLTPFLESIQQYLAIGDTLVSSNPAIAALVWGSVKFVLVMAKNFAGYFERLNDALSEINRHLPRLEKYKDIYKGSQRVRDAVDAYFAEVVLFCGQSVKVLRGKGFRHYARMMLQSYDVLFETFEANLKTGKEEIDQEIALASELRIERIDHMLQMVQYQDNSRFQITQQRKQSKHLKTSEEAKQRILEKTAREEGEFLSIYIDAAF